MKGSIHIGTYFNIPVKVHWSFGLLLLFVVYIGFTNNLSLVEQVAFGLSIGVLFTCVILHEYGHALMAKRFGTKTRDIIISPIGGVARLESIPEEPYKELLIALAGPLVNVGIMIFTASLTLLLFSGGIFPSNPEDISMLKYPSEFIRYITLLNMSLFFFNLIPAFPMDGGRVLRSLLAMGIGKYKATKVASYLGKGLSFVFIGLGIYYNQIFLGLIGMFVYFAAGTEYRSLRLTRLLQNTNARSAMRKNFTRILPDIPFSTVIDHYSNGEEKNFLVVDASDHPVGVIPEIFIQDSLKSNNGHLLVHSLMSNKIAELGPDDNLYQIYNLFNKEGIALGIVKENNEITGVVDRNIISEIIRKG